ncbi:MAG: hypothetical protein BGO69_15465 [Bacteroidetes bacterium 46-16]|nr:MAG: hypothetical protein BGO69_15465 [Bacteroidetes bacterium 46-16]
MKKLLTLSLLSLGVSATALAQSPYVLLGHSYTQNFNGIGAGLPDGWMVYTNAYFDTLGTPASFVTAATAWDQGAGTFGNFAAKDTFYANATAAAQNASPNRALGAKIGTANDTGTSFVFRIDNTRGLSNINFAFKLQSLDLNAARTKRWYVSYGMGSNPTSFSPIAGGYNTGNNTFSETNISVMLPGAVNNQDSNVWIRVSSFFPATGSLVYPTVGIDDVNITWTGKPPVTVTYDSTNIPCHGGLTGSITNIMAAGGAPGYTYALDSLVPNPPSFSDTTSYVGLPAGTHTIMVKDTDGTITYFPVYLTEPAASLYVGGYDFKWVTCAGGDNGWAAAYALNGTSPYQYSWDGGPYGSFKTTQDTNLALNAGVHVVHVMDTNGCVAATNITISEPDSIRTYVNWWDNSCFGDSTGEIDIDYTTGGYGSTIYDYTYVLSVTPADTGYAFYDLPSGMYTITTYDDSGCHTSLTQEITSPPQIQFSNNVTDDLGNCTGSVTVTVTGGVPNYYYDWSTGLSGNFAQTISDLCDGQTYYLMLTDDNGCVVYDTITIHGPVSVANTNAPTTVKLYPNPVSSILYVDADKAVNVQIQDLTGRVIINAENAKQISMSNLANGVYIVNILDENNKLIGTRKIVKQ